MSMSLQINRKTIGKDIIAGLTAAIAGIPDGMASATLAGVNPVYGLYNLLVGTPLAAIFTSEFLHPRVRNKIKPTIEVMASLPSVVLGFLAGLVIAPFVEDVVPTCLATFFTVPFASG